MRPVEFGEHRCRVNNCNLVRERSCMFRGKLDDSNDLGNRIHGEKFCGTFFQRSTVLLQESPSVKPSTASDEKHSLASSSDETLPAMETSVNRSRSRANALFDEFGPGAQIGDTYRVIRRLGEGGMGVVVLARDLSLERDVAIKLIRPDCVLDERSRRRFLTEARAMARVRHPNVVEIFAYGEVSGAPYFAMEHVPGQTLDRWMRARGGPPLPLEDVVGVLDQVCRGLSAIHATGALHRDIKPSNILVGPEFRVVVADFGLAKSIEHPDSGEHGAVAGTPAYMAPELFGFGQQNTEFRPRADIYALGVVAFELLTGRMPYEYTNLYTLVHKLITSPPMTPTVVRQDLPHAFDEPLLRALARHPSERTSSAEAFRQELAQAFAKASERARSVRPARRLLVADDDPEMRALARRILGKAMPHVMIDETADGLEALAHAQRALPDAVLLDLDMPGLNGVELTSALRELATAEQMPIVVMTGSGTAADWRVLSQLGANAMLLKPMSAMQLVTLVRGLLDHDESASD